MKESRERCISVFFVAVFVGLVVITGAHSVSDGERTGGNPLSKVAIYKATVAGNVRRNVGTVIVLPSRMGAAFGSYVGMFGEGGIQCHFFIGRYRFFKRFFAFQESAVRVFPTEEVIGGPTHGKS